MKLSETTCTIENCKTPAISMKMCTEHYQKSIKVYSPKVKGYKTYYEYLKNKK